MDEQSSQQNVSAGNAAPPVQGLPVFKKDLIISAAVGLLCAILILPIAQNLGLNQTVALALLVILPVLCAAGMWMAYQLAKVAAVFYQIAKFVLVGALNTFVDWGILNLLMFLTSIVSGGFYSVFKGISFLVATTNSYFWNKRWTFKKIDDNGAALSAPVQNNGKEVLRFFIVSFIGFLLNISIATFLVNVLGPQFGLAAKLWANVGALAGSLLGLGWNFVGYKLIVFKG